MSEPTRMFCVRGGRAVPRYENGRPQPGEPHPVGALLQPDDPAVTNRRHKRELEQVWVDARGAIVQESEFGRPMKSADMASICVEPVEHAYVDASNAEIEAVEVEGDGSEGAGEGERIGGFLDDDAHSDLDD